MTLDSYLKWFAAHERTLIIALVMGLGVWGFNHRVDKTSDVATQKALIAKQAADAANQITATALQQMAQQQAAFNQATAVRDAEIVTLTNQIASRDAASATRVKAVEAPKTPTQAVADVQTNYVLPAPITVTADGADVPTADLQLFTVTKINGDTCTNDLQDTRTELSTTTAGLTQATGLLVTKDKAIADLEAADVKTAEANAAEVKQIKAEARKSKFHWFLTGVLIGLGLRSIK
jgi:predicted ribosome quality control (RQC) complex YloA/Tae2 family protein